MTKLNLFHLEFKAPHPITYYLPELEEPESFLCLTTHLGHVCTAGSAICNAYRQRRKDSQTVLLMAIIGLVAFPDCIASGWAK